MNAPYDFLIEGVSSIQITSMHPSLGDTCTLTPKSLIHYQPGGAGWWQSFPVKVLEKGRRPDGQNVTPKKPSGSSLRSDSQ
jgi:hypothetical protein